MRNIFLPVCFMLAGAVLFSLRAEPGAQSDVPSGKKMPNVAGQFYPADPEKLSQMIDGFLAKADVPAAHGEISCVIVPHAGYVYSGAVAGDAYKMLEAGKYDVAVVIAPSHFAPFRQAAVWPKGFFNTPLGDVRIDEDLTKKIMELNPGVKDYPEAFSREHSLEVHLPFLQKALGEFKLVPLLLGDMSFSECSILAHTLNQALSGKKALVVASTDLSHYLKSEQSDKIDDFTVSLISSADAKRLYDSAANNGAQLCGIMPVTVVLEYARESGFSSPVLLKHANSGDASGDYSRVVGYASFAVYAKPENTPAAAGKGGKEEKKGGEKAMLNTEQRKKLLKIARSSIEEYLKTGKKLELNETDPVLLKEMGGFVTLHEKGRLRGCIGNLIGSAPLYLVVRDMAVQAAVGDPRFTSVQLPELGDIDIEISALSPMERVDSADKIVLGKHGVLIRQGFRNGVFLPQVATETGWSKEEFLSTLCSQKAGLPADAWKDKATEIYIFSAEVFGET